MLDEKVMAKVEALLPLLRKFPCGDYGIAVGGAHAKKMDDSESDLDLYVFLQSTGPISLETRNCQSPLHI